MVRFSKATLARKANTAKLKKKFPKGSTNSKWRSQKIHQITRAKLSIYEQLMNYKETKQYYLVESGNELRAITIGLLKHKLPILTCRHLLVGSSVVTYLLRGNLTPKKTHGFFITSAFNEFGRVAEAAVSAKYKISKSESRVSSQLPFICATPDFIFKNRVIEVKSTSTNLQINNSHILQVLIALEIFNLKYGEIHVYKTVGTEIYNTQLIETIGIEKLSTLFTSEFIKYAIRGYVSYISCLMNFFDIFPTLEAKVEMTNMLSVHSTKTFSNSIKSPQLQSSPLCRDFFAYKRFKDSTKYESKNKALWNEASSYSDIVTYNSEYYSKMEKLSGYYKNKDEKIEFDKKLYSNFIKNDNGVFTTEKEYNETHNIKVMESSEPKEVKFKVTQSQNVVKRSYRYDEENIMLLLQEFTTEKIIGDQTECFNFC